MDSGGDGQEAPHCSSTMEGTLVLLHEMAHDVEAEVASPASEGRAAVKVTGEGGQVSFAPELPQLSPGYRS